MKSFWQSWKTTLLGLGAGALNSAANGTSWKNIGLSVALAFLGAFAQDHGVKPSGQ